MPSSQTGDLFRQLFNHSPDGMLVVNSSGICLQANSSAHRLIGIPPGRMIGKKVLALFPFSSKSEQKTFQKSIKSSGSGEFEFQCATKGKSSVEVGVRIRRISRNGNRLVVMRDITRHKTAEQSLSKQARMLDFANDTIMIRNLKDEIVYWNKGAERLYGWGKKEAIGQYVHHFLKTVFPVSMEQALRKCMRDGYWDGVLIHTKRDGTRVTVASRWTMERDETGQPTAFLEINNDISERVGAEEELRRAHSELEKRVVERTQSLSAANARLKALSARLITAQEEERSRISRDLHDDLGQIITFMGLNLERALKVSDGKRTKLIARAVEANRQARTRLRALSSLIRPPVLDDVGLKEAIYTYLAEFKSSTGIESQLLFNCRNTDFNRAASTNVYRILQEALTNVSKHARAGKVWVRLERNANRISLLVKDDGAGFRRSGIKMNKKWGLLGIKERAELLGGQLVLNSKPGHGTEIHVSFPTKGRNAKLERK
jgi:PAS domain S-box-containing protein